MNIGDEVLFHLPEVEGRGKTLVKVQFQSDGLTIHPEGMGVYDGDYGPICIERANGKIRLLYWPDINNQDPIIVDMSGALETARKKVKDNYDKGECPDCGDPIPDDAVEGGECANCGHVWNY